MRLAKTTPDYGRNTSRLQYHQTLLSRAIGMYSPAASPSATKNKKGFDRLSTIKSPNHYLVAIEDGLPIATEVTP